MVSVTSKGLPDGVNTFDQISLHFKQSKIDYFEYANPGGQWNAYAEVEPCK